MPILERITILAAMAFAALCIAGCAGSGPNGEFTPADFAAVSRTANEAVATYEHLRYPDRPVYPPGAPFPIYPSRP